MFDDVGVSMILGLEGAVCFVSWGFTWLGRIYIYVFMYM